MITNYMLPLEEADDVLCHLLKLTIPDS